MARSLEEIKKAIMKALREVYEFQNFKVKYDFEEFYEEQNNEKQDRFSLQNNACKELINDINQN